MALLNDDGSADVSAKSDITASQKKENWKRKKNNNEELFQNNKTATPAQLKQKWHMKWIYPNIFHLFL